MQGLNFNFNSTYIQNKTHETDKSLNFEKKDSQVSFMDLLNREVKKNELPVSSNENVHKTDKDVSENNSVNKSEPEKEEALNKDVKKAENNSKELVKEDSLKKDEEPANKESLKDELLCVLEKDPVKDKKSQKVNLDNQLKKNIDSEKNISKDLLEVNDENLQEANFDLEKIQLVKETSENSLNESNKGELINFENANFNSESNQDNSELSFNNQNEVKSLREKKSQKKFNEIFSVTDLRTEKNKSVESKNTELVTSVKQTSKDSVQMTMNLTSQAEKNILSLDNQTAGSTSSTFQSMLQNQITQNAIDFVKAGKIVLKDNNVGKIDLILHPESLGNVKISLELSDKNITGKIIVSSFEALKAFTSTQESLKTAFVQNGFDSANFDVSYSGGNQNFSNGENHQGKHNAKVIENAYENFVTENSSVNQNNSDIITDNRSYSINFVA